MARLKKSHDCMRYQNDEILKKVTVVKYEVARYKIAIL